MKNTLGRVIKDARVKLGLTQRQLAERTRKEDGSQITPQYLNDIEFDRRTPSEHITRQIGKVLDLDSDYLILMAGSLPEDILEKGITEETARQAVSLFRKKK